MVYLRPDDHLGNVLSLLRASAQRYLKRLDEPVDSEWLPSPLAVNAFYNKRRNSLSMRRLFYKKNLFLLYKLAIPAGLLQEPFVKSNSNRYVKCDKTRKGK